MKLRTLIYGANDESREVVELLQTILAQREREHQCLHTDNLDDFQVRLVEWNPGLAIVLANGAAGMEGVYLVKRSNPDIPIFWFSDDRNFGMQSHRLECAYFAAKPVTREKLEKAFQRCTHVGVNL